MRGGVVADHVVRVSLPVLVASSTEAPQRNTLRPVLQPVACFRIDNIRFTFGLSFIGPESTEEWKRLAAFLEDRRGLRPAVFAHADGVGNDDLNKIVSGRRAKAVYALLVRDTALWEELFSSPFGKDEWGLSAILVMLHTLGLSPGPVDGTPSPEANSAIGTFQRRHDLPVTGTADAGTRAVLFREYMDAICVDGGGAPFIIPKEQFLHGGRDREGKGDYQGCSAFNPVVVHSTGDEAFFRRQPDTTLRDLENGPNRRVVVFLFPSFDPLNPERWPCPRAMEGPAQCRTRLWSDADVRRRATERRRHFLESRDTFACRFYDRIAGPSPCEATPRVHRPRIFAARLPSRFSTGKTFPKPSSIPTLREIARRAATTPSLRIFIVGHTDRTGSGGVNTQLSRARAAAVAAFLIGDKEYFRRRFDFADPVHRWSWEEVQWMLSAIEVDGDPCYAGVPDGQCSDVTHAALLAFQLTHDLPASHHCGEPTLLRLIEEYLKTLGDARPKPAQIQVAGLGSLQVPREFGEGGAPFQGIEFEASDFVGFRRVELFLSDERFVLSPPAFESQPGSYPALCNFVTDEIDAPADRTFRVRFVDLYGRAVPRLTVSLFSFSLDTGEESLTGSFSTSPFGLLRLDVPSGFYAMEYIIDGLTKRASLFVHPDEVGGMTVRVPFSTEPHAHASALRDQDRS